MIVKLSEEHDRLRQRQEDGDDPLNTAFAPPPRAMPSAVKSGSQLDEKQAACHKIMVQDWLPNVHVKVPAAQKAESITNRPGKERSMAIPGGSRAVAEDGRYTHMLISEARSNNKPKLLLDT